MGLAVVLGQCHEFDATGSQQARNLQTPQTSVNEDERRIGHVPYAAREATRNASSS